MRKIIILNVLSIFMSICLVGCGQNDIPFDVETTSIEQTTSTSVLTEVPIMVRLDDKLYVETGETNSMLRCGNLDFDLTFSGDYDSIPTENGTTNYPVDSGGGQRSWRENRIEICIGDTWYILAYNENDIDDVSLNLISNTDESVSLELVNNTDFDITYGEYFSLEKREQKTKEWFWVDTKNFDFAFNEIAYILKPGKSTTIEVDFEWLYGKLEKGTYRIVKYIFDGEANKKDNKHWYSVEFNVK